MQTCIALIMHVGDGECNDQDLSGRRNVVRGVLVENCVFQDNDRDGIDSITGNVLAEAGPPIKPEVTETPFSRGPQTR